MRTMNQRFIVLSLSLSLLLGGAAAIADDPVMIRIYNDGAEAVVVSVYDMNGQPPGAILSNQRINGFAWISVPVSAGTVGKGHVKWTARTADTSSRKCGYRDMHGVASGAFVYVFANSSCR
jgi:hypothetical protein